MNIDEIKNMSEIWINKNYPDFYLYVDNTKIGLSWKEKLYITYNGLTEIPKCYCGNYLKFKSFLKGYTNFCSKKCVANSDMILNKKKNTCIEKYGVDNPMKNKDIVNKLECSILNKYGVNNISTLEKTKNKVKNTNLNKFGYEYVSKREDIKKILSNKMHDRQDIMKKALSDKLNEYILDKTSNLNIKFINIVYSSNYKFKCDVCNNEFEINKNMLNDRLRSNNTICTICNKINSGSDAQDQIIKWIKTVYNGRVLKNNRDTIKGELDIYLPDLNIAIEYNGIYWHSDVYKNSQYHINKTNECSKKGIRLIHIWEDDWINKKQIILSMLTNLLGYSNKLYARKCVIAELKDNNLIRRFLEENHLQGFVGSKFKIGLFYEGQLVSLMTFGELRKNMGLNKCSNKYELLRFCNKINTSVIGGASKLFKYFVDNYKVSSIISYANMDWSVGNLYTLLNFKELYKTKPNYFYVKNGIRYDRFSFRKSVLVSKGKDINLSESEIMKNDGYVKIYNCGNIKYEYINI